MAPQSISIEHVNPFLKATIETYKTMIGVDIIPGKPTLNKGRGLTYDISGVIGISGDVKGSVTMSYPNETALKTVSKFLFEEVNEIDDDLRDAIGELANIVAGYAKKFLNFNIMISLPTVISGQNLVIQEPSDVFSFVVPFSCAELGDFDVGVGLKAEKS